MGGGGGGGRVDGVDRLSSGPKIPKKSSFLRPP